MLVKAPICLKRQTNLNIRINKFRCRNLLKNLGKLPLDQCRIRSMLKIRIQERFQPSHGTSRLWCVTQIKRKSRWMRMLIYQNSMPLIGVWNKNKLKWKLSWIQVVSHRPVKKLGTIPYWIEVNFQIVRLIYSRNHVPRSQGKEIGRSMKVLYSSRLKE